MQALSRLATLPHCLLLESSLTDSRLGRFAFLTADPVEWFTFHSGGADPFLSLRRVTEQYATVKIDGLPPFQGGLAGLFTYELGHRFEKLPKAKFNPFELPEIAFGLYDFVLCWDMSEATGWLISQGISASDAICREEPKSAWRELEGDPFTSRSSRQSRAQQRAEQIFALLAEPTPAATQISASSSRMREFAPQFEANCVGELTSNFDRNGYLSAVERAIGLIRSGDVFEVNLSQQLLMPARGTSLDLYEQLRNRNPSTFGGYFDLGAIQVVSASPERLLQASNRNLESRPIKGTRKHTGMPVVDLALAEELLQSGKDRAENAMIVDLVRNDFSRVCTDDSVLISQFCELEKYGSVVHLVSAVVGEMRVGVDVWDAIRAIFPGGSVTGCPKIRAMEIITELEQSVRGVYCGSLGYVGLDGSADFNLLIRTVTSGYGWWQFPVGGAIVAQSDPVEEYEETWIKAASLLHSCLAVGQAG